MTSNDGSLRADLHIWQREDRAARFISGIRAALPLATEQLDVMLYVIKAAKPDDVSAILDLGCGDGLLGRLLMEQYPAAKGIFVDFSEPMLEAAKLKVDASRSVCLIGDLSKPDWQNILPPNAAPFDVVVSGYAIHHLTDERKRALYRETYDLLKPGGVFINIEHVASPDEWVERLFFQSFAEGLFAMEQSEGNETTREEILRRIYEDDADEGDIVASVEVQCDWLREIGFRHVDCYMKIYALAVFGGVK